VVDRPAVEAGLAFLDHGGDFADGVIAHQGYELGGDVFVSFDKNAVGLVEEIGEAALLLG
jgi:predicted nucleic-acid-binding protein